MLKCHKSSRTSSDAQSVAGELELMMLQFTDVSRTILGTLPLTGQRPVTMTRSVHIITNESFKFAQSLRPHYGPEVNSASKKNISVDGVKGDRHARLTTLPPSANRLPRKCYSLDTSTPSPCAPTTTPGTSGFRQHRLLRVCVHPQECAALC
jgi:hypothetical protein